MWVPRVAVAAGLLVLVAWSFQQRWTLLTASPFPLGVDGYLYPVELRALLAHGTLAYPSSPLAFYLLAPFAAATDPITGAKLGAALYGAAIALPAYGAGARLGDGRGAGLVAAVIATTSIGSTYLTAEFVQNGVGLTVALVALWLGLIAAERPTRGRLIAALGAFAAAWLTHRMAAAFVLAVGIPTSLAGATAHGRLRGRRLIYLVAGAVIVLLGALAIGAAVPGRLLSLGDAALARGLLSATPRWSAPALVTPDGELALGHDALLGLGLAGAIGLGLGRRVRPASPTGDDAARRSIANAAAWPIVLAAIAIGLPVLAVDDREGLGFRLRIAAFVPAALAAAICARTALAQLAARHREPALAALAVALAVVRQPGTRIPGEVVTRPALVSAALALRGAVPAGATLIVPERRIAFLLAWYTGAPVALRPEAVAPDRRYRVLPRHCLGDGSPLERALDATRGEPSLPPPLGLHAGHPDGLVLVAEPTWAWVVARLPADEQARCQRWPTR